MRLLALSGAALFALTLTSASGAHAAQTVCSAIWSGSAATPGGTKSAPIEGSSPVCPASSILATVTVGTGANAGVPETSFTGWSFFSLSNQFPPTSNSAVAIGSPASASTDLTLIFDKPAPNPYFYSSYFNSGESITFSDPFTIVQSNGISVSGSTISGGGSDAVGDAGFVAQFLGDYSQIKFKYTNTATQEMSFAFTTGVAVPAPLPILGLGVALSQRRKLRTMSAQLRNRQPSVG